MSTYSFYITNDYEEVYIATLRTSRAHAEHYADTIERVLRIHSTIPLHVTITDEDKHNEQQKQQQTTTTDETA